MHISMGTKSKSESSNQEAHYESQLLVRTWPRSKAQRKKERKKEKKEKAGIDSISNDVPDYCKKPESCRGMESRHLVGKQKKNFVAHN